MTAEYGMLVEARINSYSVRRLSLLTLGLSRQSLLCTHRVICTNTPTMNTMAVCCTSYALQAGFC
jgi:hypothetical protein